MILLQWIYILDLVNYFKMCYLRVSASHESIKWIQFSLGMFYTVLWYYTLAANYGGGSSNVHSVQTIRIRHCDLTSRHSFNLVCNAWTIKGLMSVMHCLLPLYTIFVCFFSVVSSNFNLTLIQSNTQPNSGLIHCKIYNFLFVDIFIFDQI